MEAPEEDVEEEENIYPPRTLKDILLGNQLPPHLLIIAISTFVISFQVFIFIAGIFIDKYWSVAFSITFLIVPCFWGIFFYFSRGYLISTAPLQRVLQVSMLSYFADTIVYLGQWIAVYGIIMIIQQIYKFFGKSALVLLIFP